VDVVVRQDGVALTITDIQLWSIIILLFTLLFMTALGIELESGIFLIFAGISGIILLLVVFEVIASVLVSGVLAAMSILLLLRGATDMLEPRGSSPG
jgi:hypothetical protein